ncbi:MAG TPA: DUF2779 domain-containing protein [Candidatus Paceibacterota bacterium]|nr:DUF2779 domain-containing protein [Candidatus Paceibacterota bacterium]
MNILLTKTDFKEYLLCPKNFWLSKKCPEEYIPGEYSLFLEKLIKEGYEIEAYAQKLFPGGVELSGEKEELVAQTAALLREKKTIFQASFVMPDGLFAKIDILHFNAETEKWDIYEVKASTEVKTDRKHNHLKDLAFQTVVCERAGVSVGKSSLVLVNKDYRRDGEIDPTKLLVVEDMTEKMEEEKGNVSREIDGALEILRKDDVSKKKCDCVYRSHGQWCDSFAFFNPEIPEYSVHHVVTGKKLHTLLDDGIYDVKDIPEDFELTEKQREKVVLQKLGDTIVDKAAVCETLSNLVFPIYFLDYETLAKPVPFLDGYKTNQNLVFQVSLHVLSEDGALEHFEYLAEEMGHATEELLRVMKKHIGPVGSVLVWYEAFEKTRNKELAELHPEYRDFLEDVNARVFDLMTVFKKNYLHPDFHGSTSIKKVLPVIAPEFSYKDLDVQNGTMAMSEWEKLMQGSSEADEKEAMRKNLLKYCERDTYAMVLIYQFLEKLCRG